MSVFWNLLPCIWHQFWTVFIVCNCEKYELAYSAYSIVKDRSSQYFYYTRSIDIDSGYRKVKSDSSLWMNYPNWEVHWIFYLASKVLFSYFLLEHRAPYLHLEMLLHAMSPGLQMTVNEVQAHDWCRTSWEGIQTYIRELGDKVIGVGLPDCPLNVLICGIPKSITDVLSNGCGKEHRFLTHNAHVFSQPFHVEGTDIMAIQQDLREQFRAIQSFTLQWKII